MEKWMKGRYMANQKRLSVGTGVPAPRGRGIVMLILLALVVALAVVSVTTVAKLSSVNSRNIAMMQEQCRDAVALSTTLSRTRLRQHGTDFKDLHHPRRLFQPAHYRYEHDGGANEPFCGTAGTFGGIVRTIKREGHCTRGSAFLQRKILKIPEKKREMRRLIE